MNPHLEPRPPTYSTARLDSLVCPVLVDSVDLESCLPKRAGIVLPQLPHVPKGRHPIIVEIWRVQDGLIEFEGATAHDLWERASRIAGFGFGGSAGAALGAACGGATAAANPRAVGIGFGPWGWWWGIAAGAAVGATTMATTGAMWGAQLAAAAGRRTSEINSRVIGTYNEIIVTVPCRRERDQRLIGDVAFVLGTYTDSMASMLGEWLVGWGYGKSEAFGCRRGDGSLEVSDRRSGLLLRMVNGGAAPPLPAAGLRSTAPEVVAMLSQPLIGLLPTDRLMASFLDRSFEDQAVRVTPVSVRLESSDAFLPGLRGFVADIGALGTNQPWGAFAMSGLPVRLSYPRSIDGQAR